MDIPPPHAARFMPADPQQPLSPLMELPREVLRHVTSFIDWETLRSLRASCWEFRCIADDITLDNRMARETAALAAPLEALNVLEEALQGLYATESTNENAEELRETTLVVQHQLVLALEHACAAVAPMARWPSPMRAALLRAIFASTRLLCRTPFHDWASLRLVVYALVEMNREIGFPLKLQVDDDSGVQLIDVRCEAQILYQRLVGLQREQLRRAAHRNRVSWDAVLELMMDHLPFLPPHPDARRNLLHVATLTRWMWVEDAREACDWLYDMTATLSPELHREVFETLQFNVGVMAAERQGAPLRLASDE
ncbi:hypothetical protein GT347_23345 [Xylophilus rhododendri]|uniref:F-box domain-containing protein n=1 Tax=Xylophilus rhododendri TaxID=2697032 RepID=A0A857J9F0_9BURK|nr:hypothetical protein [Xylophilus rhododendri]QHJ00661.1 hypothetical protein GT347_23345 [Xylophilus rhododendri]